MLGVVSDYVVVVVNLRIDVFLLADLEIGFRCDEVRDFAEQKIKEHYGQLGQRSCA